MNWLKRPKANNISDNNDSLLQGNDLFYISKLHVQSTGVSTHEFLHFKENSQVCGIEIKFSQGSIDKVVEQFSTIPDNILMKGQYKLRGQNLVFQLRSQELEIDYQGQICGDHILLHKHSKKNGYQSDETYFFVTTRQKQLETIIQNTIPKPGKFHQKEGIKSTFQELMKKAWEYEQRGDITNALQDFDRAIEATILAHNSYYGRGIVYSKTKNYTMAIADLNRAIALETNFPAALSERGLAFVESGNLEQALADYNKAIHINPKYGLAYVNKGSLYAKQGKWAQALEELNQGILWTYPGNEVAYINRAITYEQLGDIHLAIGDLEKYLELYHQGSYIEYVQKKLAVLKKN